MRERPNDATSVQTAGNRWILKDIHVVIKIDELMMTRLAEDNPDRESQRRANSPGDPASA